MSARSTEALAYLRERYPLSRFLPLAMFLATAGHAGSSTWEPPGLARSVLLALGLVLQFRLWDDLESLPEDRREHPDRVLCQARSRTPFLALLGITVAFNTALLLASIPALLGYAALCGAALCWYRWLAPRLPHGALTAHGVLLKYPALVAILHAASGEGTLPPLVPSLVYLCFCVHELLHDRRLLSSPGMPRLLRAEMLTLWAASVALCLSSPAPSVLWGAQLALSLGAPGLLMALYQRSLGREGVGPLADAVFALSFLQTLSFTLRSRP
ncbi:hypothetical protein [Hyalangium rubrum]|uniref:UbiA prenyltransferase n=1 Tax=Hyalangium rubrum TaxID=3103134 RepID=A0ABU5H183_9BACT|nr:hypothetical protein [Hyalangium sp. s54d21]MDY7227211.1 hypothetical protein [Hyalangium sp. s54d21]